MPETRSIYHARLILEFVRAALRHWRGFVTSSVIAGLLWWTQGVGWLAPRHWVVWTVVALGLLIAVYRAWADERLRVETLTDQINDKKPKRRRELSRIASVLHRFQDNVVYWREVTNGHFSKALPTVEIVPPDLSTALYEAEDVKPDLRSIIEEVVKKVSEAQLLIAVYLSQVRVFHGVPLEKRAFNLLDEAAPQLDYVIVEIEAFEKGLR
jgi:hypothetical protein